MYFCGEPISEKSREHVIPQWLIEMTGEKKRIATFGIDYSEIFKGRQESEKTKYRKYPFLQFTFPACKRCNETYGSTLEVDAKHVITKVLTEQKINAEEIAILLNWFDKVRIGLWLISSDAYVQSCFLYCYAPFWDKHIENNADFYDLLNKSLFRV